MKKGVFGLALSAALLVGGCSFGKEKLGKGIYEFERVKLDSGKIVDCLGEDYNSLYCKCDDGIYLKDITLEIKDNNVIVFKGINKRDNESFEFEADYELKDGYIVISGSTYLEGLGFDSFKFKDNELKWEREAEEDDGIDILASTVVFKKK